jgi:hypothetical protein
LLVVVVLLSELPEELSDFPHSLKPKSLAAFSASSLAFLSSESDSAADGSLTISGSFSSKSSTT